MVNVKKMKRIKLYNCLICLAACETYCCPACLSELPFVRFHCLACQRSSKLPNSYCVPCREKPSYIPFTVPLLYEPPISHIIGAFKLGQQEHLCVPLANLFAEQYPTDAPKPDLLIPVPSHPKRMWERGYNPALLIARRIGKLLNIPVDDRAVKRSRHTPPQRLQTKRDRSHNLKEAFQMIKPLPALNIALVDDVVTTGETLRALAQTVSPHVKSVVFWAIAEKESQ